MRYVFTFIFALALAAGASAFAADDDDKAVTLSGCVVPGEGHGYLLTNISSEPPYEESDARSIEPGPVGTSGAGPTIFYWLDDDTELATQIGHQVTVEGELNGEVKPGEMKIDRTANWTDIEITSDGRTLKARVPESLFALSPPAPLIVDPTTGTTTVNLLVRRVDAKHVRMVAANCE